jgi:hypothetical protein
MNIMGKFQHWSTRQIIIKEACIIIEEACNKFMGEVR